MSRDRTPRMTDETSIRRAVRDHYGKLARTDKGQQSCCGPGLGESATAPWEASQVYAGCGSPVEAAGIKAGEVVVDLGSGGGYDVFRASKLVGESGKVIGVDATPEMVWRARETAKKHEFSNVEFRLGEIEHLPVDSNSADVVISNCAINLVPDKSVAFREAYRILKPGGRLVISDVVTEPTFKIDRRDLDAWAECVAGALPESEYLNLIREAGFPDVQTARERAGQADDKETQSCCGQGIFSVTLTAIKSKRV